MLYSISAYQPWIVFPSFVAIRSWLRFATTATWMLFVSSEIEVSSFTHFWFTPWSKHRKRVISQLSVIDLLGKQHIPPSLEMETDTIKSCCELAESKKTPPNGRNLHQEDHCWLDLKVIENLPLSFKKGKEGRFFYASVNGMIKCKDWIYLKLVSGRALVQKRQDTQRGSREGMIHPLTEALNHLMHLWSSSVEDHQWKCAF